MLDNNEEHDNYDRDVSNFHLAEDIAMYNNESLYEWWNKVFDLEQYGMLKKVFKA